MPASSGRAKRRRSRSSPRSNSRRASRPTTKKKNVIRPLFTHPRRSSEIPCPPRSIESAPPQNDSYDELPTFTHASAATAAASRTAAPPVSVWRKFRSGVWMLRAHAVRPVNAGVRGPPAAPSPRGARTPAGPAQRAALAQQIPALVERDLQLVEPAAVGVGGGAGRLPLPELVLLGDELLDPSVHLGIVHQPSSSRASPRRSTHVVPRTATSTISTPSQLRQRTTVPGARRKTVAAATRVDAPKAPQTA